MEKVYICITRQWADPGIRIEVTGEGIGISTPLNVFLGVLAEQMGSPAMLLTRAALLARLTQAADATVLKMKNETARAM